jgi:protein ImuA
LRSLEQKQNIFTHTLLKPNEGAMPVISPNALAPPVANDLGEPVSATLREQVRRLERAHSAQRVGRTAVPLGLPEIDRLLPDGGLLTGALHEIEAGPTPSGRVAPHDGAALGFTAFLLGRLGSGTLLWCRQSSGTDAPPYAPTLAAWFDPARLLLVTARRDEDLFWAMEEGLRTPGIAAVVGETRAADPTAGRRLSLAAEKNGVPALLLRAQPAPSQGVCATRWRVASAPAPDPNFARWRIELRRNRFGMPSAEETPSWLLEWNDETRGLAVVPQARHGSAGENRQQRLVG